MNANTTPKSDNTQKNGYPSAVYAAAGIGDLAYQQLRKLPEYAGLLRVEAERLRERAPEFRAQASQKAETLRNQAGGQFNALRAEATGETSKLKAKAAELSTQATGKATELTTTTKVDIEKIRTTLITGAQTVSERAAKLYDELVARGEKVAQTEVKVVVIPPDAAEHAVADIDAEAAEAAAEAAIAETVATEAAPNVESIVKPAKSAKPAAPRKPKGNSGTAK